MRDDQEPEAAGAWCEGVCGDEARCMFPENCQCSQADRDFVSLMIVERLEAPHEST